MPTYGFKLMTELHGPAALLRQARAAEEHGFGFLGISDHIHPWLDSHGHSPFAWSVLGAIAEATESVELITMVTCPIGRYHPAVVAQMAATIGVMSEGRFTLGLGTGELLNEHVTGQRWPRSDERQEHLGEVVEAIQSLYEGGFRSYRGRHVEVVDTRIYDLPDQPVPLAIAAGGSRAATLAGSAGVGLVATDSDSAIVEAYAEAGGDRTRTYTEVALAWHPDEDEGRRLAHDRFRFGALGWKVMPELPNVTNFEAATRLLTEEQIGEQIPHGPDPKLHAEAIREYIDAGFEHIAVLPVGDDLDGFLRFWDDELRPLLP
jgi:G6PDH family F420-dependent oxidoreductase